jgi:hypothetical protein
MANYHGRLKKLESTNARNENRFGLGILNLLQKHGHEGMIEGMNEIYKERGKNIVVSLEELLLLTVEHDVFFLENYRGLVPEEVLRRAYSTYRNSTFPPEKMQRVRELAGLYDDNGELKPEYVYTRNGGIVDAKREI